MVDLRIEPVTNIDRASHVKDGWVSKFFDEYTLFPIISPDKFTQDTLTQRSTKRRLAELFARKVNIAPLVQSLALLAGVNLPSLPRSKFLKRIMREKSH
jgi:hypothetical protein